MKNLSKLLLISLVMGCLVNLALAAPAEPNLTGTEWTIPIVVKQTMTRAHTQNDFAQAVLSFLEDQRLELVFDDGEGGEWVIAGNYEVGNGMYRANLEGMTLEDQEELKTFLANLIFWIAQDEGVWLDEELLADEGLDVTSVQLLIHPQVRTLKSGDTTITLNLIGRIAANIIATLYEGEDIFDYTGKLNLNLKGTPAGINSGAYAGSSWIIDQKVKSSLQVARLGKQDGPASMLLELEPKDEGLTMPAFTLTDDQDFGFSGDYFLADNKLTLYPYLDELETYLLVRGDQVITGPNWLDEILSASGKAIIKNGLMKLTLKTSFFVGTDEDDKLFKGQFGFTGSGEEAELN